MPHILLLGHCPLPAENTAKTFGPGLRTWQFARGLLDAGNQVTLVASRIPFVWDNPPKMERSEPEPGFDVRKVPQPLFEDGETVQKILDEVKPDAIVGATSFPSSIGARLKRTVPLWADLYGHLLAEAQAKVATYRDDRFLDHFWQFESLVLDHADLFSVVSRRQEFATIGELGTRGRLNRATAGYEFTRCIPCCLEGLPKDDGVKRLRGKVVSEDAFVLLSSGGFNTWLDATTLFQVVEQALQRLPNAHFVCTGGSIAGHDEQTYPAFAAAVEASPIRDRVHLMGWVSKEDVPAYFREANLALNVDKPWYEGLLGSRNRLLNWMEAGLPFVTTRLSELSEDLATAACCRASSPGDVDALVCEIVSAAKDPDGQRAMAERALAFAKEHYSIAETTRPLLVWAAHPAFAPDREERVQPTNPARQLEEHSAVLASYSRRLENQLTERDAYCHALEQYVREVEGKYAHLLAQPWMFALYKLKAKIWPKKKRAPAPLLTPLPNQPLVSALLISYNGGEYLFECLDSLAKSTWKPLEILVWENASADRSLERLKEYRDFPICIFPSSKNLGFGGGVNALAREAKGELLLLINQDAFVEPETIERLVREFQKLPTGPEQARPLGILGCKILHPGGKTLQHAGGLLHPNGLTGHYGANEPDIGLYDEPRPMAYVTGAALMMRKEVKEAIGPLDPGFFPAYFEELDFCCQARILGYEVRYLPTARVFHHESTTLGKSSRRFLRLYHRNRIRFLAKHYGLREWYHLFLRWEVRWLRQARPKGHIPALLAAYFGLLLHFPTIWGMRRRSVRRRYKTAFGEGIVSP